MPADRMRDAVIADSQQFAGITDGVSTLSHVSGVSAGVGGDGWKMGTRVDLDVLCGVGNERCVVRADGNFELDQKGKIKFNPERADGKSLQEFLKTAPEGKDMAGLTGGVQGAPGTVLGTPYAAGTWVDQVIEAFSGPHDLIGGKLSGLYDAQGNIKRGMPDSERQAHEKWTVIAIAPAAPFAASTLWSPELWKAVSVVLGGGK